MKKESLSNEKDLFLKLFLSSQLLQKSIKITNSKLQEMMYLKISIKTPKDDKLIIKRNLHKFKISFKRFEIDHFQNNPRKYGTLESTLSIKFVKRWMKQN